MAMENHDLKDLKRRYLVWFYKTTKEAWDKIERKFTQIEVDELILEELKKDERSQKVKYFIDEFEAYIKRKSEDGLALKYDGKELKPEYLFLSLKLEAIEKAIVKELGKPALSKIKALYEKEMTERILKSTEH